VGRGGFDGLLVEESLFLFTVGFEEWCEGGVVVLARFFIAVKEPYKCIWWRLIRKGK
jgi:hypothetical protein